MNKLDNPNATWQMKELLRIIVLVKLATLLLFSQPSHARKLDPQALLHSCNKVASKANESNPMRIDRTTNVRAITCAIRGERVEMIYTMELLGQPIQDLQKKMRLLRESQIASWCTNPQFRKLLEYHGVAYEYYDGNGRFLNKNSISISDC
jgi:hypothetical protein